MKLQYIPLTQGQYTRVDEKNWAWLMQYQWGARWNSHTKSFYAYRNKYTKGKQTSLSMARVVLGLKKGDKQQIDHISHDTLDNRIKNIRIVSSQENAFNRIIRGYGWSKEKNAWETYIGLDDLKMRLGFYSCENEILAAATYLVAKTILHPTAPMKKIILKYCKKYGWDIRDLHQAMKKIEKKILYRIARYKKEKKYG